MLLLVEQAPFIPELSPNNSKFRVFADAVTKAKRAKNADIMRLSSILGKCDKLKKTYKSTPRLSAI